MSPDAALCPLRIGCVQYLNAKPLIHGYNGPVVFEHPARLAAMLSAGELDVALVPVFELFRGPHYRIVDGVAIASRGPVYSVFLAYRGDLGNVRSVAVDHASLTSAHLIRCVLAEFHGLSPRYVRENEPADARLLIGNQAIAFRQKHADGWQFLDLGEEWTQQTGLPFVYALWLIRPEIRNPGAAAHALRRLKKRGVAGIGAIAEEDTLYTPEFARRYLSEFIQFELGDDEKAGLEKFHGLVVKHGLAANQKLAWDFV